MGWSSMTRNRPVHAIVDEGGDLHPWFCHWYKDLYKVKGMCAEENRREGWPRFRVITEERIP